MEVLITAISGLASAIAAIVYALGGIQGPPSTVVAPKPATSVNTTDSGSW
ncbi:hypothetical protein ABT404_05315 [Streptomyces hyaluromycini]|uniref:Secreted protein n=1 Tax=Streptomyces hyaluromycini TaxID=1377993 RepID=A0ABV1WQX0_9ACTN